MPLTEEQDRRIEALWEQASVREETVLVSAAELRWALMMLRHLESEAAATPSRTGST